MQEPSGSKSSADDKHALTDRRTTLALSRTVLATERTYSAWIRTAIGFLAGGLALASLMRDQLYGAHGVMILSASVLMIVVAIVIAAYATQKYRWRTDELGSQVLGRWSPWVVLFIGLSLIAVGIVGFVCLSIL